MGQGDADGRDPFAPGFPASLAAARGGDARARGDLLEAFRPYLLAVARRELPGALRRKYDGADVVQETLLEAHRGFAGFSGADPDGLRVWLCGILKHTLLDLIRRHRDAAKRSVDRERSLDSGDLSGSAVDPGPTPMSVFLVRERVAAIREALSRLPEDERAVIALRHFDALSFQEVGHRLDRTPEAARKLLSRAIVRLQHLLEVTHGMGR